MRFCYAFWPYYCGWEPCELLLASYRVVNVYSICKCLQLSSTHLVIDVSLFCSWHRSRGGSACWMVIMQWSLATLETQESHECQNIVVSIIENFDACNLTLLETKLLRQAHVDDETIRRRLEEIRTHSRSTSHAESGDIASINCRRWICFIKINSKGPLNGL